MSCLNLEAALLSSETTAAMAAMTVELHAQHDFTHACATDGGKGDGPPRGDGSQPEERTAFGLVAYSTTDGRRALGGALPPGSTVQDAEMHALLACVRWAADPRNSDTAVSERRLYRRCAVRAHAGYAAVNGGARSRR